MDTIQLGDSARDTATEFEGKVTATAEYLGGASRVQLSALDERGALREEWFDAGRIELT